LSARRRGGDAEATTVFIVAASDVVRAGLESLLAPDARFAVVGSAAEVSEFATQGAEGAVPDVVVFDAEGRDEEALDILNEFVEEEDEGGYAPAFVLLGARPSEAMTQALRAGVLRALLPSAASGAEIVAAVEAVAAGLFALDAGAFATLISVPGLTADEGGSARPDAEPSAPAEPQLDALTPREREVLDMLAPGLSNKEIAWQLKISEHTVKFHVASVFAKLNVSTRAEAVMQGIRRGLIMM
jgi:two-component system, NarL family, response regulator YdfI